MATNNLEAEFTRRFKDAIKQSNELGYPPTRIEQMLATLGAVNTAKRLVIQSEIHVGFIQMAGIGRKDLTIESLLLEPQFQTLFTEDERFAAQWRLDQVKI
ncbi:MAG: hypothetical protein WCI39_12640 [Gallionellaceae bacterium]